MAGPEPANECSADANEASGQILGAHGRTEDMDVETRQGGVGLKAEISGEVQREKVGRNEEREKNVLLTGEDTFEACPGDGSSGPRERGPVGAKPPPFETPFETASIEEPPGDCQASPLQTDRCTKTSGQAWRCPLRRAFGYSKCHKHLEMERRKHARRRARNEEAQRERARAEGSYVVRAQEAENGRGARDAEVPSNGRAADQNLEPEPEPERTQSAGSAQKGDFPAARSQNDSASKPSLKSRTGAESAGFGSQLGDPTYPLRNRKRKLVQMEKKRQDAVGGRAEDPIVIASDDDTPVTKRPGSSTALSRIDDVKERSYSTGLWLPPPGESTERPAEDFVLPEISGEEQPGRVEGARAQESGPSYDWSNKRISDADVVREAGGGISSCDKKGGVRLVKEDRRAGPVKETQISEALYRRASREPTKVAGRRE